MMARSIHGKSPSFRGAIAVFFTVSHQAGLGPWTMLRDTVCMLMATENPQSCADLHGYGPCVITLNHHSELYKRQKIPSPVFAVMVK
jgi:hypothetical protein